MATDDWKDAGGLKLRPYSDYDTYLAHQASKLKTVDLTVYEQRFKQALTERLRKMPDLYRGRSVLCIGARTGVECEAFIECGCFAVGVDLNPGERNRYVVVGDFHALQFATSSIYAVYTNALDHVFEFDRVIAEVVRVLMPSGLFIADIVRGMADEGGRQPGAYESAWWESVETPISRIQSEDLTLISREHIAVPFNGDECIFERAPPRD